MNLQMPAIKLDRSAAPPGIAIACIVLTRTVVIGIGFGLTVIGWSAMWATALRLIEIIPVWSCALLFLAGLGLIPFTVVRVCTGVAKEPPPWD
jgi:hypothetical protein